MIKNIKKVVVKLLDYFLILTCLLTALGINAQEYHNNFDQLTTRNGLSQNDITTIFQDSKGYIWIGTHDGLNRYDGYSIKKFRKDPADPHSFRSSLMRQIAEDSLGNLWVGSDDEGLTMYERTTGLLFHFRNTADNPNLITDNHINKLLIDDEGHIWAGTKSGLNKITFNYELKTISNEVFRHDPENYGSLIDNRITSLHQDEKGNIWVGSQDGLSRYYDTRNAGKEQFIHYEMQGLRQVFSIQENSKGLFIVGNGIFFLPFEQINRANAQLLKVANIRPRNILSVDDSLLWCATHQGVIVYEFKNNTLEQVENFRHQPGNPSSLSGDIVNCILEDKSGLIWIGTDGAGVNIYKPNKKNFTHYTRTEDEGSIAYNKVRAVFEDSEENIWIGTMGSEGLSFLQKGKNFENGFKRINISGRNNFQNFVYAIDEYEMPGENLMLIGSGYPTTFKYGKSSDVKKGNFFSGEGYINTPAQVFSILVDADKNIWLGTYEEGLFRYKIDSQGKILRADSFKFEESDPTSISSSIIRSIAQDKKGNIWIGTGNGVNKLTPDQANRESPEFIKFFHDENDKSTISHNYILPIYVTDKGEMWIGTLGGGLNKVLDGENPDDHKFVSYTTRDGLPNNVIKAIIEDDNGDMWCSSNMGLTRFSPDKMEFENFGVDDGLQDVEFGEIASCKRADGQLLFGGVNGFNTFFPYEVVQDTFEVDLVFDQLQILNTVIAPRDTLNGRVVLKADLNSVEEIDLSYSENSFSISFSTLHFVSPIQNKYAYKLEGFDNDWIYTSADNRIAKYTNLSPGKYKLRVKGTNQDGYWSSKELSISIVIDPPWWGSTLAIVIYAIAFISALWIFRKYTIITNTRKNEYKLEHMEKKKLEELNQFKLRFFTNVSHEFRTPLTLIIGLMERLKNHSSTLSETERQKYYQPIIRNSKTLLNLINQLLTFRKLEQGKMKLCVSYNDLGNYITMLGQNFYVLANQKNIEFKVTCGHQLLAWFDPEIIERVVFNLLSNAFKFTPNHGEIELALTIHNEQIEILVKNNGPGIPKDVQEHIFERFAYARIEGEQSAGIGLSYVKDLIEMHHGSITFKTEEKNITVFKVTLPTDKNAYSPKETTGTRGDFNIEQVNDARLELPEIIENKTASKSLAPKNHTLLLVEDNIEILSFLEETFKEAYNIFKAQEGSEAISICLENNIDLVISDVMMPGMDGYEFCEILKSDERINHIPVILLTAKDNSESKLKGYSLGADAYITKPFSIKELETRLGALIESRTKIIQKFQNSIELTPSEAGLTKIDEKFLNRILKFVEDNISVKDLSVAMVAQECGLSQEQLNKKLKVLVGDTTNSFIRNIRLKRAAQLLKKNIHSVSEVMYEVGFMDPKYFRKCFKEKFGKSPKQYQKYGDTEVSQEDQ